MGSGRVDLQSKKRHKSIAFPRQVCMFLARRFTPFSLAEIGVLFRRAGSHDGDACRANGGERLQ